MSYKNFSTILTLIVTLSGCQTIIPEYLLSQTDSPANPNPPEEGFTESSSAEDLFINQDVMLAVEEQHQATPHL